MGHDKALIEASFAMQYGIRLAREDIAFGEYCRLLSGLTADTPLGRVVAIRAEKNPEKIKGFGDYERTVRKRWREFANRR
ncbi:MAG: bacteriophage Gp15 family protein, partial [Clostridiales bacterium]|nr:bacteriophage Gp15 family protein [Clostridiales bacterium]